MCGFLVSMDGSGLKIDEALFAKALNLQNHRGPDDTKFAVFKNGLMGFKRLAIIDLSSKASQPRKHGPITVAMNGEIYNYKELREELKAKGHVFESAGDAEVFAALLHVYGLEEACKRAHRMWAMVAHDETNGKWFVSRDRLGIKPLWMAKVGGQLSFSSEIKSLITLFPELKKLNRYVLESYLTGGHLDASEESFFENIRAFPAGHFAEVGGDLSCTAKPFWKLGADGEEKADPERLKMLMEEAVELHMRSDVLVGLALSGGLDSTILAYFAKKNPDLKTYSVRPPEAQDESHLIDQTVKLLGLKHRYLPCEEFESLKWIDFLLQKMDQPFKAAQTLYQFAIRKQAAEDGVKVFLVGDGADEVYGGYTKCVYPYLADLLREREWGEWIRSAWRFQAFTGIPFRLLLLSSWRGRTSEGIKEFLMKRLLSEPIPYYLRIEDGISMSVSLETRVPFLDHVLLEEAMRCKSAEFMRDGKNKAMLRNAMNAVLPQHVKENPKKFQRPGSSKRIIFNVLWKEAAELFSEAGKKETALSWGISEKQFLEDRENGENSSFWMRAFLALRWMQVTGFSKY